MVSSVYVNSDFKETCVSYGKLLRRWLAAVCFHTLSGLWMGLEEVLMNSTLKLLQIRFETHDSSLLSVDSEHFT